MYILGMSVQPVMQTCSFVLNTERAYLPLKFKFLSVVAEHATGRDWQRRVHTVKLQWVRRSGKFWGVEAEQKEWNLASLLGSERFLLASCQEVVLQRSAAQLQNLYHVVVPELHHGVQRWKYEKRLFFLTKFLQVTGQNFKWGLFFWITIQSVSIFTWIKYLV